MTEDEKTKILNNNSQMLVDICRGIEMKNPWREPTPEELSYISNSSLEAQIEALIEELSKRDMKLARTFLKLLIMKLSGPTNTEPFSLPIPHRN